METNKGIQAASQASKEAITPTQPATTPRVLKYARKGVQDSRDLRNYLSALLSDLAEGAVAPNIANSASNVTGKLLRVVELEYRYGISKEGDGQPKRLSLTVEEVKE